MSTHSGLGLGPGSGRLPGPKSTLLADAPEDPGLHSTCTGLSSLPHGDSNTQGHVKKSPPQFRAEGRRQGTLPSFPEGRHHLRVSHPRIQSPSCRRGGRMTTPPSPHQGPQFVM